MRGGIAPVQELDTQFLIHPPRPLFPNVQDQFGEGIPVGTLLLDLFPGAAAAYSLRLLRTAYVGAAIRVIRTSDNAEQDIGFLPDGTLDISTLQTFVGISDGLVKIQYDQSTNGFDLDAQTDTDNMPKIIIAGVLQTTNNLPAMLFDGIGDVLFSTLFLSSPASELFTFGMWQKMDLANNSAVFNLDSPNAGISRRCTGFVTNQNGAITWDSGNISDGRLSTSNIFNDLIQHQYTLLKTAGTDNQKILRDGIQLAQKTPPTTSTLVNNISLGSDRFIGSAGANINWQEFVFYNTNELSNVSGIEDNQIDFWQKVIEADKILVSFPPIADNTYQFYKFYQIKKGQASGVETNVPLVIIDSLPAGTFDGVSGFDIRVFNSFGVLLPYERIDFVINVDGSGDIIVWLNMELVKDGEFVQLTFGKAADTDAATPSAVYDAGYKGVYHMNNTLFGSNSVRDSTSNNSHGTPSGTGFSSVVGKIGNAIRKPITDGNRINLPADSLLDNGDTEFTLTAWGNPDSVITALNTLFAMGTNGTNLQMYLSASGELFISLNGFTPNDATSPPIITTGVFTYFVVTLTNNDTVKLFVNGVLIFTQSVVGAITINFNARHLGGNPTINIFEGILDEMTASNIARSDDYILTQYNNQNDNDAFWHKTPLLTKDEDNFLVDDQGRFIVAEGQ